MTSSLFNTAVVVVVALAAIKLQELYGWEVVAAIGVAAFGLLAGVGVGLLIKRTDRYKAFERRVQS